MTQAVFPEAEVAIRNSQEQEHLLSFQEYLEYEGESDVIYELVRGRLIPTSAPTLEYAKICDFLVYKLQQYFADKNLALVAKSTVGVRTEENSARIPDALVCHQSLLDSISDRPGAGVLGFDEKPILVVEIVSSDRSQDYVTKRREYKAAEIPEYWLVDPKKKLVRVFANPTKEKGYSFVDFTEDMSIISGQLENLSLSVRELFAPPLVEELIKEEKAKIKTLEERAEAESQRAEAERQRAEKLAQRLLEMGVNPDEI